jgi:hypothetical protein
MGSAYAAGDSARVVRYAWSLADKCVANLRDCRDVGAFHLHGLWGDLRVSVYGVGQQGDFASKCDADRCCNSTG